MDVVANNWMQVARRAFDRHLEYRRALLSITVIELFRQRRDRLCQFIGQDRRRSQVLNRVAAFDDGLIGTVESLVEYVGSLRRIRRQQVARTLKAEHQSLETLQQRVVQLARDTGPLVDAFIEPEVELVCDLAETKPV